MGCTFQGECPNCERVLQIKPDLKHPCPHCGWWNPVEPQLRVHMNTIRVEKRHDHQTKKMCWCVVLRCDVGSPLFMAELVISFPADSEALANTVMEEIKRDGLPPETYQVLMTK